MLSDKASGYAILSGGLGLFCVNKCERAEPFSHREVMVRDPQANPLYNIWECCGEGGAGIPPSHLKSMIYLDLRRINA